MNSADQALMSDPADQYAASKSSENMADLAKPHQNGSLRSYVARMRTLTKSVTERNARIHSTKRSESSDKREITTRRP